MATQTKKPALRSSTDDVWRKRFHKLCGDELLFNPVRWPFKKRGGAKALLDIPDDESFDGEFSKVFDKTYKLKPKTPPRPSTLLADNALAELIKLAKIPPSARKQFSISIEELVAWWAQKPKVPKLQLHSAREVAVELDRLRKAALNVRSVLWAMRSAQTDSVNWMACRVLEVQMNEAKTTIAQYIAIADGLATFARLSADEAERWNVKATNRGRPRGTTGNQGFDEFVKNLLSITDGAGGDLKFYKGSDGWTGELLRALGYLKPILPQHFPEVLTPKVVARIYEEHQKVRDRLKNAIEQK
jgi:hypothetical protein